METNTVKNFYNTTLQNNPTPYEQERWFKSGQHRAGYVATKKAMQKYALPLLQNDMKVFELGPGPGTWTKLMLEHAPQAEYNLVDISKEMLKQAKEALSTHQNISYVTSDILEYSVADQYDFFFSSRILEYVPDKNRAVHNIVQAMHSGAYGYLVTKTPQEGRVFSKRKGSQIHSLQISANDLIKIFQEHGCVVHKKIHVTCVFPKMHSGFLDSLLSRVCTLLPFAFGGVFSESYAIVFQKQ